MLSGLTLEQSASVITNHIVKKSVRAVGGDAAEDVGSNNTLREVKKERWPV